MARPPRHNVDYFPHYIGEGKKIFIIETKFGNDGYTAWFKILETLAKSTDHWLDLSDTSNLMFLAAKCRVSEDRLIEIISALANLREIDVELWEKERVIWSLKFTKSIEDAYNKRSNDCLFRDDIILLLRGLGRCKQPMFFLKGDANPQSKVKETKEEKSKVNQTKVNDVASATTHPLIKFINEEAPTVASMKQPLTNEQAEKLFTDLNIVSKEDKIALKELIQAMENYVPLKTKSKSANLTIRKWWSNAKKKSPEQKEAKFLWDS